MKRPLALIGLTSMLALTVCFYADLSWIKILLALSLLGFVVTIVVKKLRQKPEFPAFFAVVIVVAIGFNIFNCFAVKPVQDRYHDTEAYISAVLIKEPEYSDSGSFYTLETTKINNEDASIRLNLYSKQGCYCEIGDTLNFKAELIKADSGKYLADRIYIRGFCYTYVKVIKSDTRPVEYYFSRLRQNIGDALYRSLSPDTAALAKAMLLGDTSDLRGDIYDSLRRAGLSHIVVVSGLHLSIITMLYKRLFGRCIRSKLINTTVILLLVLSFLFLTGFGKSSIRAAIMLLILFSSKLFKRQGDSLNSLGLAAILFCIINPCIVGDVGVLLSFSATFGIVVFSTPLEKFLTTKLKPVSKCRFKFFNRCVRYVCALVATTAGACLCTLPVNVIFFGKVSLVQIITNLTVVPLVQCFMFTAAFCVVFYFISLGVVADFFGFFAEIFGNLILDITRFSASFSFAYVKADYGFVMFWIFAIVVIFSIAYLLVRNAKGLRILCVVMCLLVFISGCIGHIIACQDRVTVYINEAKGGQSVVISNKDENILFITAENKYCTELTNRVISDANNINSVAFAFWKEKIAPIDYKEILMYDNIKDGNHIVKLWNKGELRVFGAQDCVYAYIIYGETSVLVLPAVGDVQHIPEYMRSPDVLVTCGIIGNMDKLSFNTLIANGDNFHSAAVIDFYQEYPANKLSVVGTVNFDIVG